MRILATLCLTLFLAPIANAKIVFRSNRDGNSEIYVMNDDGSNIRRLTNNPLSDGRPRWSPDGKQIVFDRRVNLRDTQRWHLFIINADGTNERQLTEPRPNGWDTWPSFSPDGKSVLFTRYDRINDENRKHCLCLLNLESGAVKEISNRAVRDAVFTPDGKHITFSGVPRVENADGVNVYVMDADGKNVRGLLPPIPEETRQERLYASISPNGKQILYFVDEAENVIKQLNNGGWAFFPIAFRIIISNSKGDTLQQLNVPKDWLVHSLDWMDNGKAVLLSADADFDIQQAWDDPERTFDIYRYDIATEQITPLATHPANDKYADWISDTAQAVSPQDKQPMQWGELKAFLLPVYRVGFGRFLQNVSLFLNPDGVLRK